MTPNPLQSKKKKKILIIEDEGDMCLLLNILLDGKNKTLDHVKDLAKADEYLRKEQPDVILLDNKLPDGFGIDFIPFIRNNNPGSRVIMISGFDASAR
ncbi:MAG: response regulator, partial [Bacteroidetes bacterium]|nr:response regulator [Bacteroidota bacterium]